MKDITNKDSNNKLHGYQKQYSFYLLLEFRGNVIHGNVKGYNEYHTRKQTIFFI
jgi:hypothetical protein